jgi:hypothetical protein
LFGTPTQDTDKKIENTKQNPEGAKGASNGNFSIASSCCPRRVEIAMLDQTNLLAKLKMQAQENGLTVEEHGNDCFSAERTFILVKWALGQRKVVYKTSCRITEPDHAVHFREMVKESSWGILPPTFTVEKTTTKGWERSGTHSETAPGAGGGTVDYGEFREVLRKTVANAGWQFHLEGGRAP